MLFAFQFKITTSVSDLWIDIGKEIKEAAPSSVTATV